MTIKNYFHKKYLQNLINKVIIGINFTNCNEVVLNIKERKMTNNKGIVRGILLGSVIGLGYYLSKNKDLRTQINTKVKEGLDTVNTNSSDLKVKVNEVVKSAKESFNQTLKDTKVSVDDNWAKTSEQLNSVVQRLSNAYVAGKEAARESLKSQDKIHESQQKLENTPPTLGAVEDTTPQNVSSDLHPATGNVSKSIGDAGTNFEKINTGKFDG